PRRRGILEHEPRILGALPQVRVDALPERIAGMVPRPVEVERQARERGEWIGNGAGMRHQRLSVTRRGSASAVRPVALCATREETMSAYYERLAHRGRYTLPT